jgi:hypothetical protein
MTTAFILVVVALVALWFLVRLAKGNSVVLSSEQIIQKIRPVDIVAFRNLVDPNEEQFLRANLPPSDFRRIHRERLWAAAAYVSGAAQNAALLLKMGEMARRSPEPSVAEAGVKLVENALRMRMYAMQARARIYIAIVLPQVPVQAGRLTENYENMTRLVVLLGVLRFPTNGIASSL